LRNEKLQENKREHHEGDAFAVDFLTRISKNEKKCAIIIKIITKENRNNHEYNTHMCMFRFLSQNVCAFLAGVYLCRLHSA